MLKRIAPLYKFSDLLLDAPSISQIETCNSFQSLESINNTTTFEFSFFIFLTRCAFWFFEYQSPVLLHQARFQKDFDRRMEMQHGVLQIAGSWFIGEMSGDT
ncbi:hypothetical protein EES45_16960 [Streptomyces sp. ADI97-07]|nr:hypothetical protein EES45_16960 [Streptomyces sp. ADI97-07]